MEKKRIRRAGNKEQAPKKEQEQKRADNCIKGNSILIDNPKKEGTEEIDKERVLYIQEIDLFIKQMKVDKEYTDCEAELLKREMNGAIKLLNIKREYLTILEGKSILLEQRINLAESNIIKWRQDRNIQNSSGQFPTIQDNASCCKSHIRYVIRTAELNSIINVFSCEAHLEKLIPMNKKHKIIDLSKNENSPLALTYSENTCSFIKEE